MLASTLILFALARGVLGHMEMSWPYPFKSKFNPAADKSGDAVDWSMTAPLGTYPCKGYIDPSAPSVVTWSAGATVNYTIAGTAVHGGGSCQISLSYDEGKTWNVIYSHIGGCLIEGLTEDVMIPKDAPEGKALFSWTWFNLLGNREMYQNCAAVTITNGGKGLDSATYPAPFVANVDAAPGCKTVENTAVVFPNPGNNVKYGGQYTGTTPKAGAGITGDCAAPQPAGGASSPASSSVVASSSASSSASASSTTSLANTIPTGNANNAAPVPSSSSSSAAAAATTSTTGPKKCKPRNSARGVQARNERVLTGSAHQHLVRRRVSRH